MVKIAFNSALAQKALGKDATAAEKVSPACRFFSLGAGLHRPPTVSAGLCPCTFTQGLFACACTMLI